MIGGRFGKAVTAVAATLVLSLRLAVSFPIYGQQTALPAGSELNEQVLDVPREVFRSESAGGRKSYLVNLGDLAFNSPSLLGGVARQAGMSCGTCHVNGASNPKLYIPHMSTRPGNFDTTGALFNPKADNGVLDPVRIPSLRGAHLLGPYGIDGRNASLRDFVRTVIVEEFAGPEPSAALLDALMAYIQDIDFLRNLSLGPAGRLTARASDAERRGEVLFVKPFPHDPTMSCATCHVPSSAFVDHRQHDVGSGGAFKTPTLLNTDFNAPYFHDGRFDTYDQVVAHFDRVFDLGLSPDERRDLIAYLTAVGDGELLTEIRLPLRGGAGSAHEKVERRAGDWAIAAASVAVWIDGGTIVDAGIGLSAVGPTTIHVDRAAELLRGSAPSDELFAQAGEIAAADCVPIADGRGPVDYKRHLAGVLTTRALRRAAGRALQQEV